MQLGLWKDKDKDNIIFIISWLALSKIDVHTSSPIHPYIQEQYKFNYKIVHSF